MRPENPFQLELNTDYLVRARIAPASERLCGIWDAGTHVRLNIDGASASVWVPITQILPWPTLEAFGFTAKAA